MVLDSEPRIVCKIVGPYLLEIRLARTIRYILHVSRDPILTDWHEVASSNFFFASSNCKKFNFFIIATLAEMTLKLKRRMINTLRVISASPSSSSPSKLS